MSGLKWKWRYKAKFGKGLAFSLRFCLCLKTGTGQLLLYWDVASTKVQLNRDWVLVCGLDAYIIRLVANGQAGAKCSWILVFSVSVDD